MQSSLSIFTQKYLRKYKYLCIYEDSIGAKILRDDCNLEAKFIPKMGFKQVQNIMSFTFLSNFFIYLKGSLCKNHHIWQKRKIPSMYLKKD